MKIVEGHWYVETEKGVRLYCRGVESGRVLLSLPYEFTDRRVPDDQDFDIFFQPEKRKTDDDARIRRKS